VKNIYFPENSYDTPESTRRSFGDRLFLNSRWWFFLKFLGIVFRSRSCAVRGIYDDQLWAKTSNDVLKLIEKTGGQFHVRGLENLQRSESEKSLVFVSNHMSTLETMVFPGIIAPLRKVTFVVKEELVKASVFGPIMRSRNPIVVGRSDPRRDLEAVLTQGPELLAKGVSIIIFPQSTRFVHFNPSQFNSLGIKLARRSGVKVIPVAVKTDFWGNGKRIKDLGVIDRSKPIHMIFGPAMAITGNGSQQHQQIIEFIQSHLETWNR
jgi:1-acyl-sn-glycerol-3-phosphate acyltransferase